MEMNKKSEKTLKHTSINRKNKAGNSQVNKTIILTLLTIGILAIGTIYILGQSVSDSGLFDLETPTAALANGGYICADPSPNTTPDWGQCKLGTFTSSHGLFDKNGNLITANMGSGGI